MTDLLAWLRETQTQPQVVTDALGELYAPARAWTASASGLLGVSVGRGWSEALLWFRTEHEQAVLWGGATQENAKTELGPRQSFATYVEQLRGHVRPWHAGEVAEAQAIGESLSATLDERLTTLRQLNSELQKSNEEWRRFAFVISHDLQEPLRLIRQLTDLFKLRNGAGLDAQTGQLIQFLSAETDRVSSLITDLYTYTEAAVRHHPEA